MSAALRELAEAIAREAGAVLKDRFEKTRSVEFKGRDTDLVTDADHASEALILARLASEVPTHAVLSEEDGARGALGGHRWFVDPLDGTVNYAHGVPHFCVTLAVEDADGLIAGVVFDPLRDECFSAARGQGATLNGRRIQVSAAQSLERSLLCTGFPYDVRERPDAPVGLLRRLLVQAQGMRRMGSAALDLAYVACGRFDGFFEYGLKPWDIAAGGLLVREAGGVMRRIDGGEWSPYASDVLAAASGIGAALSAECAAFAATTAR
ncbi:MAG: inositol monophosphatase family protein [Archangium sp.]